MRAVVPDEIYNLGAQSHVAISFEVPGYTTDITAVGAVRLLDAQRDCTKTGKTLVRVDPRSVRPAEVELLPGDPAKATKLLGWTPTVTFDGLVEMMTKADLALAAAETKPLR